ncbi:MAG: ABC transporter permease [Planctomycetota bacterium]
MALVPISYNARSLFVRRSATLLTVVSVGATVAVFAGVLSLQQGFQTLFTTAGRDDVAVFLRPGSTSEGESFFSREQVDVLVKSLPEIAESGDGLPLASAELYLAVRLRKTDGGETNVPIRGVELASFSIRRDSLRITEGRRFEQGADEIVVGRALTERIRGARLGDVIRVNVTPFRVVGIFESDGPFESEIWGDLERVAEALERPVYSRVIAEMRPGTDLGALSARIEQDRQAPAKVQTEKAYLSSQTTALSATLTALGAFLGAVMGAAAVFTGTNTMLAAIAARTHEIGILISLGFRPLAIFAAFLLESLLLGILGGIAGCIMVIPLNGVRTGTTNFQTFTEVAFAFSVTPEVLLEAVLFAMTLGLIGGAWPAWRAARMGAVEALRRH